MPHENAANAAQEVVQSDDHLNEGQFFRLREQFWRLVGSELNVPKEQMRIGKMDPRFVEAIDGNLKGKLQAFKGQHPIFSLSEGRLTLSATGSETTADMTFPFTLAKKNVRQRVDSLLTQQYRFTS